MNCYKCHWLCFTCTGYSDYTVTGEWIKCPSRRFEKLYKYEDKKNIGLIELASKDCPFFKRGKPAESGVEDTDATDLRISEFNRKHGSQYNGNVIKD